MKSRFLVYDNDYMWLEEKYMSFAKRIYKYSKQSEGFKLVLKFNFLHDVLNIKLKSSYFI